MGSGHQEPLRGSLDISIGRYSTCRADWCETRRGSPFLRKLGALGGMGTSLFSSGKDGHRAIEAPLAELLQALRREATEVLHADALHVPDVSHVLPLLFAIAVQVHIVHLIVCGDLHAAGGSLWLGCLV